MGLYDGVAGLGFTLAETWRATGDDKYRKAALNTVRILSEKAGEVGKGVQWNSSTDIISGSAGHRPVSAVCRRHVEGREGHLACRSRGRPPARGGHRRQGRHQVGDGSERPAHDAEFLAWHRRDRVLPGHAPQGDGRTPVPRRRPRRSPLPAGNREDRRGYLPRPAQSTGRSRPLLSRVVPRPGRYGAALLSARRSDRRQDLDDMGAEGRQRRAHQRDSRAADAGLLEQRQPVLRIGRRRPVHARPARRHEGIRGTSRSPGR